MPFVDTGAARIAFPSARHEVLQGTGHLPHLEGHPRTLEAIAAFVAEITTGSRSP